MIRAIDYAKVETLYPFLAKRIGENKFQDAKIISIYQDMKYSCLWIDLQGPNIGYAGWAVAKVQFTPNCKKPAMLLEFEEVDGPSIMCRDMGIHYLPFKSI
ncbi:MAG: hypothetical protein PWR27_2154 [Petroclostridium sp.]|jgi:hypothetical protein|nr:hypothetical protein [Clostridia bacterium]MDK2811445.1 hypothetical protein [Petroclostridium sp.]